MRAVTPVMTVIMIITLTIGLVALFWLFISGTFTSLLSSGESTVGRTLVTISSCMKIESVSGNKAYVKNCGEGSITNDTLNVYLDDVPLNFILSPTNVGEDEVGTVSLYGLWGLPKGGHLLKVTNPKVITEMAVESFLGDSCVLALDFDEDLGNVVHDSSSYHNDGITHENATPTLNGKFGRGFEFDGAVNPVGSFVNITNENLLENMPSGTICAWYKNKALTPEEGDWQQRGIVGDSGNNYTALMTDGYNLRFKQHNGTDGAVIYVYAPQRDIWQHGCGVWSSNGLYLYLNGMLKVFDTNFRGGTSTNNQYVTIGSFKAVWYQGFNGTLDSVRIYNKALTPDETIILKPVKYY